MGDDLAWDTGRARHKYSRSRDRLKIRRHNYIFTTRFVFVVMVNSNMPGVLKKTKGADRDVKQRKATHGDHSLLKIVDRTHFEALITLLLECSMWIFDTF